LLILEFPFSQSASLLQGWFCYGQESILQTWVIIAHDFLFNEICCPSRTFIHPKRKTMHIKIRSMWIWGIYYTLKNNPTDYYTRLNSDPLSLVYNGLCIIKTYTGNLQYCFEHM
jgi:hypothetical protein